MKHLALLVAVVCVSLSGLPGCDSSEADPDGGSAAMDGSSPSPDSNADFPDGATGTVDAATTADAAETADAARARDGGPSPRVGEVCDLVCDHVDECVGDTDVPACVTECVADLGDCSEGALDAVINCTTVPCPGMEPCMGSVPCVDSI